MSDIKSLEVKRLEQEVQDLRGELESLRDSTSKEIRDLSATLLNAQSAMLRWEARISTLETAQRGETQRGETQRGGVPKVRESVSTPEVSTDTGEGAPGFSKELRTVPDATVITARGGYAIMRGHLEAFATIIQSKWSGPELESGYTGTVGVDYGIHFYETFLLDSVEILGVYAKSIKVRWEAIETTIFRNGVWVVCNEGDAVPALDSVVDALRVGQVCSLGISPYLARRELKADIDLKQYISN